jgi:ectoine hydroxylase-related dioxygenase (phytanoyl-CoA dioxygenase family)
VEVGALRNHPLSVGFAWQDHRGPFRRVTEQQAQQYDELGYFLLEDAIPLDVLTEVRAAVDPIEVKAEAAIRRAGGKVSIADADAIVFSAKLVLLDACLADFARSELFADLCHDLVGPDVSLWWDQCVYKKPESPKEFPWHQDNGYGFVLPETYLTCWVPLVDATVDNGCPWVLPGMHRRGTLEHHWTDAGFQCVDQPDDAVAVPARAGSVVVFSSLTPHRTGPNLTTAVRKAYILQYAPADARLLDPGNGQPVQESEAEWRLPVLVGGVSPTRN